MSKWFEVRVEIWKTVLVEVENDEGPEDALDVASEEFLLGKDGQAQVKNDSALEGVELARARRHADEVISL